MTKKAEETTRESGKGYQICFFGPPEKAQIEINEGEDLYREIRVENEVTDEHGEKAVLKSGAEVDVIVEADSNATVKKPA